MLMNDERRARGRGEGEGGGVKGRRWIRKGWTGRKWVKEREEGLEGCEEW